MCVNVLQCVVVRELLSAVCQHPGCVHHGGLYREGGRCFNRALHDRVRKLHLENPPPHGIVGPEACRELLGYPAFLHTQGEDTKRTCATCQDAYQLGWLANRLDPSDCPSSWARLVRGCCSRTNGKRFAGTNDCAHYLDWGFAIVKVYVCANPHFRRPKCVSLFSGAGFSRLEVPVGAALHFAGVDVSSAFYQHRLPTYSYECFCFCEGTGSA